MTLVGTELWERFSYYGMRAILLYFITDTLANGGLGIDRSTGVAITSIYGASVYLLSVVGGWLADRMIGARRATLYGGLVIALGHVLLAVPGGAAILGLVALAALAARGSGAGANLGRPSGPRASSTRSPTSRSPRPSPTSS